MTRHHTINAVISVMLGAALLAGLCFGVMQALSWDWSGVWGYRQVFWSGWLHTVWISLAALVLSIALGLAIALARRSHYPALRWFAAGYVEIVRGTPLLVQLLILFYVVANAIGLQHRYAAGVIILAIFSGAYIAEMIRAGIESVGRSQWDSARAIGLTTFQAYRLVILPQVLRQILPPLAGQFSSLIKDSSLLYIIGIPELTFAANQVNSATYSTFESFVPLGICYLVLTLPVSLWTKYLEGRVRYET
jgi:polar amino acid transport system permease protein